MHTYVKCIIFKKVTINSLFFKYDRLLFSCEFTNIKNKKEKEKILEMHREDCECFYFIFILNIIS